MTTLMKRIMGESLIKRLADQQKLLDAALKQVEEYKATVEAIKTDSENRCVLIAIERRDRFNIFTFVRRKQVYVVETMGLISDDINEWKKDLLEQ